MLADCLYEYSGFTGTPDGDGVAHLRLYLHNGTRVAIVGQLTDNEGASVTNRAEVIARALRDEYGPTIMVEHYPPGYMGIDSPESWDVVTPRPDASEPAWQSITRDEVEALTGEPVRVWPAEQYTTAVAPGGRPA